MTCLSITIALFNCSLQTAINFKKTILFDPLDSERANTNVRDIVSSANSLNFNDIQFFFNTNPLRNLSFIQNSSSLLSLNKSSLVSIRKQSGNLEYGAFCSLDTECNTNMHCVQNVNDQARKCRCARGFVAIFSTSIGNFVCGKFAYLS